MIQVVLVIQTHSCKIRQTLKCNSKKTSHHRQHFASRITVVLFFQRVFRRALSRVWPVELWAEYEEERGERREERMAFLCLTWPVHRTVSDKEVWILYLQISKQNPNRIVSMTTLENTCTMLASGSWLIIHMGYSCGERSGGSPVGCWSWFHYVGCSMVELQPSLVI